MIYLILDTNIWLYLANGLDPISNTHEDKLHFELLATLEKLQHNKDITILVNDVIIEEWNRNKEHTKLKIKHLTNKLNNPKNTFKDINRYVKSGTDEIQKEYIEGLKAEIAANEKHIENVDRFLNNSCVKISVSNELKLNIFNMASGKKAPFHNKKNNFADASILFSAAEYLRDKLLEQDTHAIFVSNNITDFTDGVNKVEFHPKIKDQLGDIPIKYERVLPSALKLSKEIMLQIEEYIRQEAWLDSVSFTCRTPYCDGNETFSPWGYLDKTIKVIYTTERTIDPNQMTLFDVSEKVHSERTVGIGHCSFCGTLHVECPECGELTYNDTQGDNFECIECSTQLEIKIIEEEKCLFVNNGDITI